jgi:hypothetical protein
MLTEREREQAIKEAHNIAASEAYFEVRAGVVYPQPHTIFDGGFSRGWDAGRAPLLEQLDNASKEIARIRSESATQSERIAELERQLEQAQKDAERYQWLRNEAQWLYNVPQAIIWRTDGHAQEICSEDELDEAVDAAIQSKEKP